MTWRLVTYFEIMALVATAVTCQSSFAGALTGDIRLVQSRDAAVNKRSDFSGVVVWLTSHEDLPTRLARKHVTMLQKNKTFSPHILAITVGTSVDFPNADPIFHNAFSNFEGEIFDIGLYPPGSSRSVRFTKPGVVKVFCNIHPSMAATIVVLDSNHFALTDKTGHYSIADIHPGTYEIHFFHERAKPETLSKLVQTITVADRGETDLPIVSISEAGYLPAGHKNKYGRDYPTYNGDPDPYSREIQ